MTLRIIPAIMSGGAGTRLWPLSTEDKPKQFHALTGGRSLLAETAARVRGDVGRLSFAEPIVLCGARHVDPVRMALRDAGVSAAAIVIEPAARNTAAVAAAAAAVAQEIEAEALVLLLPSDHVIRDKHGFRAAVERAALFANDRIVTFGMTPSRPANEYGYIKCGPSLGNGVFAVEAFKEKPDAATAQTYLSAGGYSWNSGMFLFRPATLHAQFGANEAIRDRVLESLRAAARLGDEIRLGPAYTDAPSLPLDVAVMEHTSRAAVVPCDISWADIGSWVEVWRLAPRGPDGFVVLGSVAAADISKMEASGVKAAAVDGDDLVVVAAPNGLLILPREQSRDADVLWRMAEKL